MVRMCVWLSLGALVHTEAPRAILFMGTVRTPCASWMRGEIVILTKISQDSKESRTKNVLDVVLENSTTAPYCGTVSMHTLHCVVC